MRHLERSGLLYTHALSTAHVGIWQIDFHDGSIHCSDELLEIVGRARGISPTREEVTSWVHPEDIQRFNGLVEAVIFTGSSVNSEFRLVHTDGSIRFVHVRGRIAHDDNGNAVAYVGTAQDVSEHREIVSQLNAVNEKFMDLYDNSPDMLLSVNPATMDVIGCNETVVRLTGFSRDEIVGRSIAERYHPDSVNQLKSLVKEFRAKGRLDNVELKIRRKDGTFMDVSLSSTGVFDEKGEILYSRSSWRDLSSKKRADAELRTLVESLPHIVWKASRLGRLQYSNRRWLEYTGLKDENHLGSTLKQVIGPDYMPGLRAAWSESTIHGKPFEYEIPIKRADGEYRWHLARAFPIVDETGKIDCWFGTCTDIDDQRRAEATRRESIVRERTAEESSRLKSELMATISHEIRTPLSGMIGMIDMLLDTELSKDQLEFGSSIKRSSENLLSLVEDILDLSKAELGKIELENTNFDFHTVVLDVYREQGWAAKEKNIDFRLIGLEDAPQFVVGDPTRVRQVFSNLVGNAIKFTEIGHVTVHIRTEREPDGFAIHTVVQDTGIGIPESKFDRLFKPFSQVDSSTTRKFGGTGLGLSICKQLVELMGGSIFAESEVDVGSTFQFHIRLGSADNASRSSTTPNRTQLWLRPPFILVAEDTPTNQRVIELMLQKLGCRFEIVENGKDALKALEKNNFDLILMDCRMPEIDGYQATQIIRGSSNNLYRTIPIVALSANSSRDEKMKCISVGMSDFMAKPCRLPELQSRFEKWLPHLIKTNSPTSTEPIPAVAEDLTIDLTVIDALIELDGHDLLKELSAMFMASIPKRLQAIRNAAQGKGEEAMARETHALKSAASYLGGRRLGRLCDQLAKDLREGKDSCLETSLEEIEREIMVFQGQLQLIAQRAS